MLASYHDVQHMVTLWWDRVWSLLAFLQGMPFFSHPISVTLSPWLTSVNPSVLRMLIPVDLVFYFFLIHGKHIVLVDCERILSSEMSVSLFQVFFPWCLSSLCAWLFLTLW